MYIRTTACTSVIEYFDYLNEACADLKFPVGLKLSIDCNLGSEIRWIITMNVSLLSSVIPCIWAWFHVLSYKLTCKQFNIKRTITWNRLKLMESELLRRRVKSTSYEPQIAIKIANIGPASFQSRLSWTRNRPKVDLGDWRLEDSW